MARLRLLLITFILLSVTGAEAAYVIHSVKGHVSIISGGRSAPAVKGARIAPADKLDIAQGAVIEIINDINNTVYTSTTSGQMTVTRLMLDSRSAAADNAGNVNKHLKFAGRSGNDKKNRVYTERGMVKRSMSTFDPDASGMSVDAGTLAARLADIIGAGDFTTDSTLSFASAAQDAPCHSFRLANTLDTPVYFNVIRIYGDSTRQAGISPLGQPSGSYVLLPGQAITREQPQPLPSDETHILVATHYSYDIDDVLDALTRRLSHTENDESAAPALELPLFVRRL